MRVVFRCFGHENLLGTHRNTIEFTKDTHLTKRGDCIVGVKADFKVDDILPLLHHGRPIQVTLRLVGTSLSESFSCIPNPSFSSDHEIVIRKTDFASSRTLGLRADKAAGDLSRIFCEHLKNPGQQMEVVLAPV